MTNLLALPVGTELAGDYRIERVLGAGGFGITYLAHEKTLDRKVTIKEYFPADFAARDGDIEASPRSRDCAEDYKWGLDRFIAEAQTLAKFEHPHIVRVYRYFRANNTGYMVLKFEEGQSLKSWLKSLGRAPRQGELDTIVAPLLDALDLIHRSDFLHRDIAPDNIMMRGDGAPVLIDFGSARGDIAQHSRTVSALVKPGYSPYEQYATTSSQQGPWTDIYALAATLYQAVAGKRPPDAPSRMVDDQMLPAREAALSSYRGTFLAAIDKGLTIEPGGRPQSIAAWRGGLLAPEEKKVKPRAAAKAAPAPPAPIVAPAATPPPPDMPQAQGRLLDFIDGLKRRSAPPVPPPAPVRTVIAAVITPAAVPVAAGTPHFGLGYGPAPAEPALARGPAQAAAPKALLGPTAPAIPAAPASRSPPRPRRTKGETWRRLRPVAVKLAIGLGVASAAVAWQDRIPRFEIRGFGQVASQTGDIAQVAQLAGHKGGAVAVRFTDDGKSLVSAGQDGTLKLWNPQTGALVKTVALGEGLPTALAVNGTRALTGHKDGRLALIDLAKGERTLGLQRNEASVWSVALTRDPDRFLAAGHDWMVALWDPAQPSAPSHVFEGHESAVQAIAVSPTAATFATGSADRTVKLWSSESRSLIRTYRGHKDFVTAVTFSPDGRTLATAALDGQVRIWSAQSSRFIRSLRGTESRVNAVSIAPDGDILAAAHDDGMLRLWSYKDGKLLRTLSGHVGPVRSLAFSRDGRRLASAGDDGSVRLWNPSVPAR